MFSTLDGVAEFPIYPDDPAVASAEVDDPMWSPRMDSIDTLLLGRKSYEAWSKYWPSVKDNPTASAWGREFSRFSDRCGKVVFSKSLTSAEWPHSTIVRGDVTREVERLRALPGKDLALGGGPRLLQSFLERDLVDELLLQVFPSLVGRGKPFFRVLPDPDHAEDRVPLGVPGRHDFKLVEARPVRPLEEGTVFLHYRRAT